MAQKLLLAVITLAMAMASSSAPQPRLGESVEFVVPEGVTYTENAVRERKCNGTVGECSDEPVNDSLVSARRGLAWNRQRYISYSAMKKNNVPCSRRGASYYNCRPGKAVNPYHRGCSAITNCARVW